MEKSLFKNKLNDDVYYLKWEVSNPKANVVISHGMAEHPYRYDDLAKFFNENNMSVYAIFQIGHGEDAKVLGHMDKGDFNKCVDNLDELVALAKANNAPTFLLGHSMGSFIAQLYIERYGNNIKGCVLSGSNCTTFLVKIGAIIASTICAFSKDKTKPSKFLDNLSFGSYNKIYENPKTKFDWLNRDEVAVQKYIDDPYCGYICSKGFFNNLTHGLKDMGKKKNMQSIPKELPILIVGGSMDPVSNCAKGLKTLNEQYQKLEIKDVTLRIYDGAHHEIYNEINKEEVYNDTLAFITNHM